MIIEREKKEEYKPIRIVLENEWEARRLYNTLKTAGLTALDVGWYKKILDKLDLYLNEG